MSLIKATYEVNTWKLRNQLNRLVSETKLFILSLEIKKFVDNYPLPWEERERVFGKKGGIEHFQMVKIDTTSSQESIILKAKSNKSDNEEMEAHTKSFLEFIGRPNQETPKEFGGTGTITPMESKEWDKGNYKN